MQHGLVPTSIALVPTAVQYTPVYTTSPSRQYLPETSAAYPATYFYTRPVAGTSSAGCLCHCIQPPYLHAYPMPPNAAHHYVPLYQPRSSSQERPSAQWLRRRRRFLNGFAAVAYSLSCN